jgi:hypothetical protein
MVNRRFYDVNIHTYREWKMAMWHYVATGKTNRPIQTAQKGSISQAQKQQETRIKEKIFLLLV